MRAHKSFSRTALLLAAGWVVCWTAGCGPNVKPTGEVFGKVMYNDKPVTAGQLMFFPEDGSDPVPGQIEPIGTFRATGIPVGKARVAIETLQFSHPTPPPPGIAKQLGGPRTKYVQIPAKYEKKESSPLEFDVKKGVNEEWIIELK
jgi:hypothetical protein